MNRQELSDYVDYVKQRTSKVLQNKGNEYSYNNGAFENFEEGVAIGLSETREAVAWGYVTKQIQSVRAMIKALEEGTAKDSDFTPEFIDEKFGDVINYMILIEAMFKERCNKSKQKEFL